MSPEIAEKCPKDVHSLKVTTQVCDQPCLERTEEIRSVRGVDSKGPLTGVTNVCYSAIAVWEPVQQTALC